MKSQDFKNTRFVKTAVDPKGYPKLKDPKGNELTEIAIAGRSNVGKSSLLNDLFQTQGLVKTSSVPGKTQALNFFLTNDQLVFVDLPGYGYAKVPMKTREKWGPMIQTYLQNRSQLKLILFLFDIRRLPNEEDKQFLEWAIFNQKSVILVLTKVDKVSKNEMRSQMRAILDQFQAENLHHIFYSVNQKLGRRELVKMIFDAIQSEEE